MPHAIVDVENAYPKSKAQRKPKAKSSSRDLHYLSTLLEAHQKRYERSALSQNTSRQLQATLKNSTASVTKILSLGLGSLLVAKGQSRRLKQLTLLLAIRDTLNRMSGRSVEMYAQDPTFTSPDEAFLANLDIRILRTHSGSELGEAEFIISPSTVIYSPFLTLEAYEELLVKSTSSVQHIVGDDFSALLSKWPKPSAEKAQVESVMKYGLSNYRRRAMSGTGFWKEEDGTFPMAIYERIDEALRKKVKAKI